MRYRAYLYYSQVLKYPSNNWLSSAGSRGRRVLGLPGPRRQNGYTRGGTRVQSSLRLREVLQESLTQTSSIRSIVLRIRISLLSRVNQVRWPNGVRTLIFRRACSAVQLASILYTNLRSLIVYAILTFSTYTFYIQQQLDYTRYISKQLAQRALSRVSRRLQQQSLQLIPIQQPYLIVLRQNFIRYLYFQ